MGALGLESTVIDDATYRRNVARLRELKIRLPTLSELADPSTIPPHISAKLATIDPDSPHPLNLFRVHWHNHRNRPLNTQIPDHVILREEFTGIPSPIVVLFGARFPMIGAHKVLAAYGCLVPRLVTGQFDATRQRAIWPSTGNYCRGGVAISRVLGCRGVAVLPEGMSEERFRWLESWVQSPADIVRTPGSESNVKEIYDQCKKLAQDAENLIFNQFCEFGNHLVHYFCTGAALARVVESVIAQNTDLSLRAFVSATGSAGTIAAGDYLKDIYQSCIVAAEALECPTMLENGFGAHNIQGIGDKHIPFIHNVMNTDIVCAVSDRATDALEAVCSTPAGTEFFRRERGNSTEVLRALEDLGLSSWCNILAAIRTAKALGLGKNDLLATIATDGANLYQSEIAKVKARDFAAGVTKEVVARVFAEHIEQAQATPQHTLVLSPQDRNRIFNLGYFTWVEQQGVSAEDFEARRSQAFWRELRPLFAAWDQLIYQLNRDTGLDT